MYEKKSPIWKIKGRHDYLQRRNGGGKEGTLSGGAYTRSWHGVCSWRLTREEEREVRSTSGYERKGRPHR